VEEDDAGHLRASGHRGSTRGDPEKVLRGLGKSGDHRRRGIARAEQDTDGSPRARFRCGQGSGLRVEASGSFLEGGALAGAGVHRSDGCMAA
jgi:hypothetical protein